MVYRGILELEDKSSFQTPYLLLLLFTNHPLLLKPFLITQLYFRYPHYLKIKKDFRNDQERSACGSEERQEYEPRGTSSSEHSWLRAQVLLSIVFTAHPRQYIFSST